MIYNIVVTYQRPKKLRTCLSQLLADGYENIILVDNNSQDETKEVIGEFKPRFSNLSLVTLPQNTGGAGGFNAGLAHFMAVANDADYALLHDDDAWPTCKYDALSDALEKRSPLHACLPVLNRDLTLNPMNIPGKCGFLLKPWMALKRHGIKRRPKTVTEFINFGDFDYASFVGYMIRRDALIDIGLPSPAFFLYSDDTTYTFLATGMIGKIDNLRDPELTFMHDCDRVSGGTLLAGRFGHFEVRNKIIFFRISSPNYHLFFSSVFLIRAIFSAPSHLARALKWAWVGYKADLREFLPRGNHDRG
jgi:rhamnopyranosyl-N-acetylglucosaminyl-diphospho-decaprenol beta-1,3/1,4-galactofuranosyltransferase